MSQKLSDNDVAELIKLYQEGKTPTELAQQFGILDNSVTRLLRKKGINRTQLIRVSQNKINQIIEQYQLGISSETIASQLDINGSTVCRILKRNGIAIRPAQQNKRKYDIDQLYFQTIDTEDKAYFLGFMYADGNLNKGGSGIKITLQSEDRDILERFSNIIYGFVKLSEERRKLEDGTPRTYLSLIFYGKDIHQNLINLGCPPDKTFDIRFPSANIVPAHLLWHFVRGVFDGDGCICITDPARPRIDFSSNLIFIKELIEFFKSQGLKCNKPGINAENPLSGSIQFGAVDEVKKCHHLMYDHATIYMNRKYQTFQQAFINLEQCNVVKNSKYTDRSRYGTFYTAQHNGIMLTGPNLKLMSTSDKENMLPSLFQFYRDHGFPFTVHTDDELIKDFNTMLEAKPLSILKSQDGYIIDDHILTTYHPGGLMIFKHFSPHFWSVNSGTDNDRKSMLDTFNDDELLKDVIKNRIMNNSNMTGNMLKQGLANSKLAYKASIFNPMVAKFIYSTFTKSDDIIYDYSMGFGQRLIAALSLPYKIKYVGVDPMQKTVRSNQDIYHYFKSGIPMFNQEADIICSGSENYCDQKYMGQVALAFSSPPYYNVEKYEDHQSQAYSSGSYIDFINMWWRQTMQNIVKLLRDDGIFALNIKETANGFKIAEDMCNVARENGMELIDTYQVQLTRNTNFGNKKGQHKYEPIFIFKKVKLLNNVQLSLDI